MVAPNGSPRQARRCSSVELTVALDLVAADHAHAIRLAAALPATDRRLLDHARRATEWLADAEGVR